MVCILIFCSHAWWGEADKHNSVVIGSHFAYNQQMALRQKLELKSNPSDVTAARIFADVFGEKKWKVAVLRSRNVVRLMEDYSEEDDETKKECEGVIAKAMIEDRISSLFDDDLRVHKTEENDVERIKRVRASIKEEIQRSKIQINNEFISTALTTLLEKKLSEKMATAAELGGIISERIATRQNSNPSIVIEVDKPVSASSGKVRRTVMNVLFPTLIVGGVIGGVSLASKLFDEKAVSDSVLMEGKIDDVGTSNDSKDAQIPPANSSHSSALSGVSLHPSAVDTEIVADDSDKDDAEVDDENAVKVVIEGVPADDDDAEPHSHAKVGNYRIKLSRGDDGIMQLDRIKWIGKTIPPILVGKCEAVNAVQVDSEVVGLECPYAGPAQINKPWMSKGRIVTLSILKNDVDLDSTDWQNIPTRINPERKKGGKVVGP